MREKYLKTRAELLEKAEKFVKEGNIEDYKATKIGIETLDADYEQQAKAQADLNVLSNTVISEVQNAVAPLTQVGEAFSGEIISDTQIYASAFAKTLQGIDLTSEEKSVWELKNAVQTADDHSVMVPESWKAGIWSEIKALHPILNDVPMTFVNADIKIRIGELDGAEATWYDEETTAAEGSITSGSITLSGYELLKCISVSWKLRKMSVADFTVWLQSKLAESISAGLASGFINGKGIPGTSDTFKSQPLGVITKINAESNTPQVVTVAAAKEVAYADITSLMSKIGSGYTAEAKLYARNDFIWTRLATIVDTTGRPIFIPDVTGQTIGKIFGRDVYSEESVPANTLLAANFAKGYAANVKENITIYTEDHVKERTTNYLGSIVADGQPLTTKAFAILKKTVS